MSGDEIEFTTGSVDTTSHVGSEGIIVVENWNCKL
jgi:hypothetical protein